MRSLLNIFFYLYLFILPIWPSYVTIKIGGLPGINIVRIIFFFLLCLWLIIIIVDKNTREQLIQVYRSNRVLINILTILFILKFISAIMSNDILISLFRTTDELLQWYVFFLIGITVFHSIDNIWNAVNVIIIASIVVFSLGLFEGITKINFFANVFPVGSELLSNIHFHSLREGHLRIQSTFVNNLLLNQYGIILLPLILIYIKRRKSLLTMYIGLLTGLLLIYNVINTHSRTGLILIIMFILLIITIQIYNIISPKKSLISLSASYIIPPVALITIYITILKIIALFNNESLLHKIGYAMRFIQLSKAIPLILENPFLGYGYGDAASIIGIGAKNSPTVDNYYLTLGAESGVIAVTLFILILLYSTSLGLRLYFKSTDIKEKLLLYGISLSIILFSLNIFTLSLKQNFPLAFLLLAGLVVLNYHSSHNRNIYDDD